MGMIAFVFPGQGSQYVGMGKDLCDHDPGSRKLFERADMLLGFSLSQICFQGPDDELRQTRNTQPAIYLHSIALSRLLEAEIKPDMVAGHSLGEYSALVTAGAIGFEDALRLVRLRGDLMQHAGAVNKGTMAAVVGMLPEVVKQVCREASDSGVVQPANFNSPGQIVISGSIAGVHKAMEIAKQRGAKLVKELVVSGAFHSPLMELARDGLKRVLETTAIRNANIPVYANVTAEPVIEASEIRELLFQQITNPVQWEQSVRNMVRDGASSFVEVGPGKVLQGLVKRIEPGVMVSNIDKFTDLKQPAIQ